MIPVRVRGKKYRQKPTASAQVPRMKGSASSTNIQCQLKRSNSEPDPPGGSRKCARIQDDAADTQPDRTLSALERLPVEILEPIFLQGLNLSLPRASPVLGSKLASEHVKSNLFLAVFPSEHDLLVNETSLLQILGSIDAIASLQSQLLVLRWMTPEFLDSVLEECMVRNTVRLFNQHGLGWVDLERTLRDEEFYPVHTKHFDVLIASKEANVEVIRSFYKQHASRLRDDGVWAIWMDWTWRNESVRKKVKMRINFRESQIEITVKHISATQPRTILKYWSRALCCIRGCRIPHKLLHGPWSSVKCAQLERIFLGGGRIDFSGATTDEEVAASGLQDALAEHNVRPIRYLTGGRRFHENSPEENDERSAYSPEKAHCIGVVVTTEHFKFALDKECPLSILGWLASAMNISVNWADKAITSWAIRKRSEGDERGEWLWKHLDAAGVDLLGMTKG